MSVKRIGLLLVLVALAFVAAVGQASSSVIRVKWDSANNGPGNDWDNACHTVTAGLASAVSGDEIWVSAGVYVERITLRSGVSLYGGFVGTESERSQRNWTSNVTVLDGNKGGSVVTSPAGAASTTVIDGFTVRNGNALYGGGMYISGNPTITNNLITGNNANCNKGGGIFTASPSSPLIANNTISGNTAYDCGGGISCQYGGVIRNNRISSNRCGYAGGGVEAGGTTTVNSNLITENTCSQHGGGVDVFGSAQLTNNTITANNAPDGGGAAVTGNTPTVANNIVAFNMSGLSVNSGTPILKCNCVYGNLVYGYSGVTDPTGSNGNIAADPKFAGAQYGNWHIQPSSPCVGHGSNTYASAGAYDIDGQGRTQPSGGVVDIGADESDGSAWQAGPYVTVRVSTDGNDSNDGSSWAVPKRTVQAAIDAAHLQGGEVWVKSGVYYERIVLQNFVHMYGGFAGTETARDQRDWKINTTTLDGGFQGTVVTCAMGCAVSTIDGFTIRNGWAESSGGGLNCTNSSPTIANNTIIGNRASNGGGGICCGYSCPVIYNNIITGNSTGAIYSSSSSPTISNNTITANGHGGAAVSVSGSYSSPSITNNVVAFNSGGISISSSSGLRNNCVWGNTTFNYSGCTDPTGTNGNISVDPQFAGAAYGNWHLQPSSPCVGAGNNSYAKGDFEIDRQPRIQPLGGTIDIGADESDGTVFPAGPYAVIRVSPIGNDSNDGLTWQSAKGSVQAAVDAAGAVGGEVWVQAGDYYGHIELPPFVSLFGGFSGGETAKEQRDYDTNLTVLDGQQEGAVISAQVGYMAATIDGFTITNGGGISGSGVDCSCVVLVISNNVITGNSAYSGGGVNCDYASVTIQRNTISSNVASAYGGGVYCTSSSASIVGNVISGNTAGTYYGGGIYHTLCSGRVANNTISGNSAESGGGIYYVSSSTSPAADIVNNIITGNESFFHGSVYISGNGVPHVANNLISGNSGFQGAGMYASGYANVTNNTITANSSSLCGGIYVSGRPTIANNIVAFNSSGVQLDTNAYPTLKNNCVFGNTVYNYSKITDPTGTNGNISLNPQFACLGGADWHIQSDSPCRDTGDNSLAYGNYDIDGQLRVQAVGGVVDIGADESDGSEWPTAPYRIVRVSPQGSDSNDGSSWNSAKQTVQSAINAAAPGGGEVWAKSGTYCERVSLRPFVDIYGGFTGEETQRSQRSSDSSLTILDGQKGGTVVTAIAPYGSVTVDGMTVRNGSGDIHGGGIYCTYCSLSVSNCVIQDNQTRYDGGGVYCESANLLVDRCLLTGNTAGEWGGGVCCKTAITATVKNSVITRNVGSRCAGGIELISTPGLITDNRIEFNTANLASAGIDVNTCSPIISNNTIRGNTVKYTSQSQGIGGGALWIGFGSPYVTNNTFVDNACPSRGGAMMLTNCSGKFANNIFAFNTSGIYGYAPVGSPVFTNNCFYGNTQYDYSGLPAGANDILADPLLRGRSAGDCHLTALSPCVNAGLNSAAGLPATDFDGQGRIAGGTVDIGADELWWTVSDIKKSPDGVSVERKQAVVTAAFGPAFYIEADDRSSGIRVECPGHLLDIGMRANVSGAANTNPDGEKYISATAAVGDGTGSVSLVCLHTGSLGGGDFEFDAGAKSGQQGTKAYRTVKIAGDGWAREFDMVNGLNNIGLLVTVCGKVTYAEGDFFYLDDGSRSDDFASIPADGPAGVKVIVPSGITLPLAGQYVQTTGISSCYRSGADLRRLLRVRQQTDVVIVPQ